MLSPRLATLVACLCLLAAIFPVHAGDDLGKPDPLDVYDMGISTHGDYFRVSPEESLARVRDDADDASQEPPRPVGLAPLASSCEAGYAPYNGDGACAGCDLGHFSTANSGACSPCPRGTFADATHSPSCTECPVGKVAHDRGSVVCETCPTGRVAAGLGSSLCVACPPDTLPSLDHSACVSCALGTEIEGNECVMCSAGSYRGAASGPRCLPCPANTYSSVGHSLECTPCAEHEFTFVEEGNTDVSECRGCAEAWHAFDNGEGPAVPRHALAVCSTALCTLEAGAVGRQLCRMYGNATSLAELEAHRAHDILATASWTTVFILPLILACMSMVVVWMRNLASIRKHASWMRDTLSRFGSTVVSYRPHASRDSDALTADDVGRAQGSSPGTAVTHSEATVDQDDDADETDVAGEADERDDPSPVPAARDDSGDVQSSPAVDVHDSVATN